MSTANRVLLAVVIAASIASGCSSGNKPVSAATSTTASTLHASSTTAPPPGATSIEPATSGSTSPASAGGQQRYEASLPIPIQEAAAATVGDRLYVVGGYDASRNSSSAVFVLNGSTWTRAPSLPIAVNHPGASAIGNDVYVAGGFTPNGATNRAFVLTPGAATWRELTPMRQARGALSLLSLGGRLYAIGGRDGSLEIATPEAYDPGTARWTDVPSMPAPRNHVAGYIDGTLACVAGGRTPDTSAAVDCFDPATATWQHRATLATGTSGAAAIVMNGVTLVAGGEPAGETSIVGVIQELRQGAWTSTPMVVPRHGTAYALYRGRLWLCGGATAAGFQAVATCTSVVA